ncbi:hypothetical protein GCM10009785_19800 [Brooklawnia cerclae]|uniref:Uncharacterized protein n=1 Tax=Brooklawnia cerclae TaxID=349934 RepID=A0ABX0SG24_9ACTN|nr:hypothetical protein [Brooklawnia cerclae]NIH57279.1 hypothetical protein [Brooklawnia cerclae]
MTRLPLRPSDRPTPPPAWGALFPGLAVLAVASAVLGLHGLTVAACVALILAASLHGLATDPRTERTPK